METRQGPLLDILGDESARFTLPDYQRPYSWDESQCMELWRDVLRSARQGQQHFAGMFICADVNDQDAAEGNRVLEIIDGQQRLTTTFLMVLAYSHYAQAHDLSFYGAGPGYLKDTFLTCAAGRKLTLSEEDRDVLFALLDGTPVDQVAADLQSSGSPVAARSRVLANFRFFQEQMAAEDFDDEAFWRGLSGIYVIQIILGEGDDPQEIFESFNSKGVSLSIADMLRNHLLVAESLEEQERLYTNYWEHVQSAFGDDPGGKRLGACLHSWVTVRCKNARGHNDREMFAAFKVYAAEKLNGRTEQCLKEMVNFTSMWAERYRYHATKAYVSYNWATLGATTLVSEELRQKVKADKDSWYWQRYMNVDVTK
ncbi:MAG: DUF262 domain-containing protein [Coriobacteriia bacterium]|nr:DUF262 domain-containing protein [Coriobacteriia bacterium]